MHAKRCKKCGQLTENQRCTYGGENITCDMAVQCEVCGYRYSGLHGRLTVGNSDSWKQLWNDFKKTKTCTIICDACKQPFGQARYTYTADTRDIQGRSYFVEIELNPYNPYNPSDGIQIQAYNKRYRKETLFDQTNQYNLLSSDYETRVKSLTLNGTPALEVNNHWISGKYTYEYHVQSYSTATSSLNAGTFTNSAPGGHGWKIGEIEQQAHIQYFIDLKPDIKAPQLIDTDIEDNRHTTVEIDGIKWATKQEITGEFFESLISDHNMSTAADIRLLDTDKQIIQDWVPANRGWYNNDFPNNKFQQSFDLVAEIREPSNVYLEARDKTGNIQERIAVPVQYIDALAPQANNATSKNIFKTSEEWQRTKDFQYKFTDKGIGKVEISFNNNQYQYGTEQDIYKKADIDIIDKDLYSRQYVLTGNVTGAAEATIYVKDGLGNTQTYTTIVHNLDNTKPKVVDCKIDYKDKTQSIDTILTVQGNDFCEAIQKDGSGVNGYAIVYLGDDKNTRPQIGQKPQAQDFEADNTFEIEDSGWYAVYVKDEVDLISEPYVLYIDKMYTITYKPNGGNGVDVYQHFIDGEQVTLKGEIYSRDKYRFSCWNTLPNGSGDRYTPNSVYVFNGDKTLYAEWDTINKLVIDPNGGSWTDKGKVTVKPGAQQSGIDTTPTNITYTTKFDIKLQLGDKKVVHDALKKGYNFRGWTISK